MNSIMNYLENNQSIINTISLPISLLAFLVGAVTLIFTIRLFYMKKGIDVRCSYSVCSSIECNDKYISNFILENRKDKSIVIFHTYLKIGHNYYLELENFENEPLIIKPFEVYTKKFDPILFYSVSMKRINLDRLIDDKQVKKRILLYTTEGTYEVKAHINLTNPITLFFKNYTTAVIRPNRLKYENKSYGENIKFLVEFIDNNDKKETLSLSEGSYKYKYNGFTLNKEALSNKESLEKFFNENLEKEILTNLKKINVIDLEKEITKRSQAMEEREIIEAKYYNYFYYTIIGKAITILENIRLKLTNYFRNDKLGKKIKRIIFCDK